MVESNSGKGSWCFGLNGLFCQMLKGLRYRVYTGARRINREATGVEPVFEGLVHMVLFVQPYIEDRRSNMTYLVDVSGGALRPILLQKNQRVMGASPSERHVLQRIARTDSSLESSTKELAPLEWQLEAFHRDKHLESWTSRVMYSFIEDEFFLSDFENFNYSVLGLRTSLFWGNVVCTKYFWISNEEQREIQQQISGVRRESSAQSAKGLNSSTRYLGKLSLAGNTLKRHLDTHSEVLRIMNTEEERASVLEEFFGIVIPPENLQYITGRAPELQKEHCVKE
ncbi:hypothetical protein C8J56DRAFT_798316 [Mycena floridula]|nr:hypothetical protein C8J56DRAFT_798316 [Mycena floridula]